MKRKLLLTVAILIGACAAAIAQKISLLTPSNALPGSTVDVVIRGTGTHFKSGASVPDFGPDITLTKPFAVVNALTGTATIHIDNNAAGPRTVQVVTTLGTGGTETAEIINGFDVLSVTGVFAANIELLPIESISLGDINPYSPAASPVLFFVNIYNDNIGKNINVSVSLSAASKGKIGTLSLKGKAIAASGSLRITNRDFTDLDLKGSEFLTEVQTLGTFPPDEYTYEVKVTDASGNVLATATSTMLVTNPINNPELIAPGNTFDMPTEDIYTSFPLFQWFGQMDEYEFRLYEVRASQTPEEAVRNLPEFSKTDLTANSFLYPIYAEKLKDGGTYAWQILGKINSSGGPQFFPSQVFKFRYVDPGKGPIPGGVASIQMQPQEVEITAGQTYQFSATLFGQDNSIITNVSPQWLVTPSTKGTISTSGLFTAGNHPATVAVVAKSGTTTDFAIVTIKPAAINPANAGQWIIDGMIRQLFGLPSQ